MLSVKTGHYHPSLENAFLSTIQSLKKEDPLAPLAVVAPTNGMLNRLQERLSQGEDNAFLNVSFMNFSVLAGKICSESGTGVGQIIQSEIIYEIILAGLIKNTTSHTVLVKDEQSLPAVARALFQTMEDLTDANVCADDLLAVLQEGIIEGTDRRKLNEIVQIYGMFRQKLKSSNIFHYSDIYRTATEFVPDSRFCRGFRHILAYGFYDLTGVEQDFFSEIFRSCPTTLFLPYRKKHPAFPYVEPFFESFILGRARDIEKINTRHSKGFSSLLDHGLDDDVEREEISPSLHIKDQNIRIINVSGEWDEIWTVAKEILKLMDEGYESGDIGVAARNLEPYTGAIKKIFHENFLSFTITAQESLEKYPLIKVVRQILQIKRENYYRPLIIELLRSPYFKIPPCDHKGITPQPYLWDMISRKIGVRSSIESWLSRLEKLKNVPYETTIRKNTGQKGTFSEQTIEPSTPEKEGDTEIFFDRTNEITTGISAPVEQIEFLENTLRILSKDITTLPERASWRVMSQKIQQFLQKYLSIPFENMVPEDQKRDRLILAKIMDTLQVLLVLDFQGEEVSQEQFVEVLLEALRRDGLPVNTEGCRGVRVMDAMSARGIPFRVLFILGLNAGVFPRSINEEPFLRDHIRRKLSEVLGNCIPEKLRGFDEERLLFYFLLNSAREKLYLLYERSDEAGKPKIPSHYLVDILQKLKEIPVVNGGVNESQKNETYIPRGIQEKYCQKDLFLLTSKEIGIRMALDQKDPRDFMMVSGINLDTFKRSQTALISLEDYKTRLTAYDGITGKLPDWLNTKIYHRFSPTMLEIYGICPFKFFVKSVMELDVLEEPEKIDIIRPTDLGTLYHNILWDFYHYLIKENYFTLRTKKDIPLKYLEDLTQRYFRGMEGRIPIPYPILWEIKKEEVLGCLKNFVDWDLHHIERTGYTPAYLEKTVKFCPQIKFPKDLVPILLKGKIDRVDIKKDGKTMYFNVIDYKTGKYPQENIVTSAIRGQRLQLPFYIILAEHFLAAQTGKGALSHDRPELGDASLVYIAQDRKERKGAQQILKKTIKENDWKMCEKYCWETLGEFLRNIQEGMYPITPEESSQKCDRCEYATICRRGSPPLQFRLEQDTRLKKYREIIRQRISRNSDKDI
ncbi:MAG: exodeoxyribonuclease V subunit gamma [Candidatus Brocadiaceae bacterium]|nr:exodeoxyribonuclease V subunit gamma [Candidatus Brocadiaceae bacterium]